MPVLVGIVLINLSSLYNLSAVMPIMPVGLPDEDDRFIVRRVSLYVHVVVFVDREQCVNFV